MARPLRIEFAGAIYHICARGNARQQIFVGDSDRNRFVELLRQSSRRFEVSIIAFVLMDNHFHLVAQTNRPNLARWMHWLLASYTMFFNARPQVRPLIPGALQEYSCGTRRVSHLRNSLRSFESGSGPSSG